MIRIIISPAKKMNIVDDSPAELTTPVFLAQAKMLRDTLKEMSFEELKKLWTCNEKIALLNIERLHQLSLDRNLSAAALSYEGLQYQHLSPQVLSQGGWNYITKHLRILSGFYGILKPTDGIIPYRLEMQAKLATAYGKDLYQFWGESICQELMKPETADTDLNSLPISPDATQIHVLNLASGEYSKSILPYLEKTQYTTCTFGELVDGKVKTKGTLAKMARGEMVRWMAENQIEDIQDVRNFNCLGYQYHEELSSDNAFVFLTNASV